MCQIMETPYGLSPPPPLLFSFPLKLVQRCLTLSHSSFLPLEKSEIEACKIYVSKMKIAKPASPWSIQKYPVIYQNTAGCSSPRLLFNFSTSIRWAFFHQECGGRRGQNEKGFNEIMNYLLAHMSNRLKNLYYG